MKTFNCLPIKARIEFKIFVLTWKAKHGMPPNYLLDLLKEKQYGHNSRAIICNHLIIPKTNNVSCGDRAVAKTVTEFWNIFNPSTT